MKLNKIKALIQKTKSYFKEQKYKQYLTPVFYNTCGITVLTISVLSVQEDHKLWVITAALGLSMIIWADELGTK